jgi:uncharacterized protein YjbJ (UPF0337 family)
MNKVVGQDRWQQIQRQVQQWWGELRNRHLYRADGKLEPFVAVLQAKYGYTREAAEEEFSRRKAQFEAAKSKPAKSTT